MSDKYHVAVAGSTNRTVLCAQALLEDSRFELSWVVTPQPKIRGRQKHATANPVHELAEELKLEVIFVEKKIDQAVKSAVQKQPRPDFLLIVDFGYIVPNWLLDYPTIFPLNIHPSELPRWRGSSPGQFVILHGDTKSAVSLMVPNSLLDQGPVVSALPFDVLPNWTQIEYYDFAFALISQQLPNLMDQLAQDKVSPQPQPTDSPTDTARQLNRADGFISWQVLSRVIDGEKVNCAQLNPDQMAQLLINARSSHKSCAAMLDHACRALYPWPGLWTKVPTRGGELRMKILSCHQDQTHPLRLILDQIQIEGKSPTKWVESKNIIQQ